jgi:hypothetical protein
MQTKTREEKAVIKYLKDLLEPYGARAYGKRGSKYRILWTSWSEHDENEIPWAEGNDAIVRHLLSTGANGYTHVHQMAITDLYTKRSPLVEELLSKTAEQYPTEFICYVRSAIVGKLPRMVYSEPFARIPEVEQFLTTPRLAFLYAKEVLQRRWPAGEELILKDPEFAYNYSYLVIGGRWPEAEPIIATNPSYAFKYAANLVQYRWPEGEESILRDPYYSVKYATDVIRGRWPKAEPLIFSKATSGMDYLRNLSDCEKLELFQRICPEASCPT